MDIQTIDIGRLNPAKYNPRKDLKPGDSEYDKLKKSILEFDLVEPLVWNRRSGNLVGGHQRLKILSELGHTEVEVSVVDMPDNREKALNLALNKISGEWDYPMLKDLLEELDTGAFDMEITGFDLKEIEDLMTQFHVPEEGLTDDDAVPEATESISRRADLWELGNHRLLCGDATVITDVERLMDGEKAVIMVTDPPYGVDFQGQKYNPRAKDWDGIEGDKRQGSDLRKWLGSMITLWLSVCANDAAFYFWTAAMEEGAAAAGGIKDSGLHIQSQIIWVKNTLILGQADYQWKHENCWYAFIKGSKHRWCGGRAQTTVWEISKDANQSYLHPMQKPVALFEIPINNHTLVNEICVDPFGGSGAQIIACEKLRRRCFMMEIDEHYCDVIIERWQQFTGKQAVRIE